MRILPHPGEVLAEDFLKPFGLSGAKLTQILDVPQNRITEIVRGRRAISADTALRLARFFETSPEFWMNMQMSHDLSVSRAKTQKVLKKIRPRRAA